VTIVTNVLVYTLLEEMIAVSVYTLAQMVNQMNPVTVAFVALIMPTQEMTAIFVILLTLQTFVEVLVFLIQKATVIDAFVLNLNTLEIVAMGAFWIVVLDLLTANVTLANVLSFLS